MAGSQVAKQKRPYDNCAIYSPTNILISKVDRRRAQWYLDRNLAEIIQYDPLAIKLKFFPNKGQPLTVNPYYLQNFVNQCVVCGDSNELTSHHVVPKCFRRHFPSSIKDHNSGDILVLCINCHRHYEHIALEFKKQLTPARLIPLTPEEKLKNQAIGFAGSLIKWGHQIPGYKFEQMLSVCARYLHKTVDDVTDYDLENLSQEQINHVFSTFDFKTYVDNLESIADFCAVWRDHFLSTMEPQFLPEGWPDKIIQQDIT